MGISRRHLVPPLRILTALVIAGLATVWVMTQTDFGRNKLRIYGVRQLAERVHAFRLRQGEKVLAKDAALQAKLAAR